MGSLAPMTTVGDFWNRYGIVALVVGLAFPDSRRGHRRRARRGGRARALLLRRDPGHVLDIVAAGIQDDCRADGREHLERVQAVGVCRRGLRRGHVLGNRREPRLPLGVVPADEPLHVARRGELGRRRVARLKGGVGLGDIDDLRVGEHQANKRLSAALEGSNFERHRRTARLRIRSCTAANQPRRKGDDHRGACDSCCHPHPPRGPVHFDHHLEPSLEAR